MIMPSKIIKPVDSLFAISSEILKLLRNNPADIDSLFDSFNENYYKVVSFEKFILAIYFLFIIQKVELDNGIIKTRIR